MNSKYLYYLMIGAIGLMLISLIGSAYGVDKMLASASQQLVAAKLKSTVLDREQSELAKAKSDIKRYSQLADIARNVVPQDKDQAQTVNQIVALATANGVSLGSITFPSSNLGKDSKGSALSQLTPVKDVSGVYSLQLTVQSDISKPVAYSKFIGFLQALEHNRRTALVQSVTVNPNIKDRSTISFSLVLVEYIKP